jgi:drug/metabolite transporter (DMT)-like permease
MPDLQTQHAPSRQRVGVVLTIGIIAVSAAAIFIRLAIAASGNGGGVGFGLFLSAARLTIASLVLLPAWKTVRAQSISLSAWKYAIAAGFCLAFHFAAWITSLTFTSIAASAALVTTNPVWVALISWLWFREAPSRVTATGIGVTIAGGTLIALGDSASAMGSQPVLGNGLALLGAIMASLYFLLGREAQRQGLGIGSYAAIAYTAGAVLLLPLPLLAGASYWGYGVMVYVYTLAMAIASQVIGHTALNWSVRWASPTLVTLALLFEPVGASLLGVLVFQEIPSVTVMIGAVIVLGGVAIAIVGEQSATPA